MLPIGPVSVDVDQIKMLFTLNSGSQASLVINDSINPPTRRSTTRTDDCSEGATVVFINISAVFCVCGTFLPHPVTLCIKTEMFINKTFHINFKVC